MTWQQNRSAHFRVEEPTEVQWRQEWEAIDQRLRPARRSRRSWAITSSLSFAGLAVVAAGLFLLIPRVSRIPVIGQGVATVMDGSAIPEAKLHDGSRISLSKSGQARVTTAQADSEQGPQVRIELLRGDGWFDVAKQRGRTFVVVARGVQIRVVGTRFHVRLDEGSASPFVRTTVERGAVEVRKPGEEQGQIVNAGASLQIDLFPRETESSTARAARPSPSVSAPSEVLIPPSEGLSPSDEVFPQTEEERTRPGAKATLRRLGSAAQIFAAAKEARHDGDVQEAARLYQLILSRFPHDRRMALAAFELGRIRSDHLRDFPGAIEAFSKAVHVSAEGSLREDARARLVYVFDAMGEYERCQQARADYLSHYPTGVHVLAVNAKCGRP
jgi:transmembrane sensor